MNPDNRYPMMQNHSGKEITMRFLKMRLIIMCGLSVVILSGCVNLRPMALQPGMTDVSADHESIALFTLRTDNQYKPSFPPDVTVTQFLSSDDKKTTIKFKPDKPYEAEGSARDYLISIQLSPGPYVLDAVSGMSNKIFVIGSFSFPIDKNFVLETNEIVYLGRLEMVNRERKNGDERRSGSVIPLIDQSVTGYSGGTFDIKISDNFDNDVALFKQQFPFISEKEIMKRILSP